MQHLLDCWPDVAPALRTARHILVLSDYDGTLTPIVERPELALLGEETRRLISAMTRRRRFGFGILSGRALFDLKTKVAVSGIIYAGNHGLEIEGPGLSFVEPVAEELRPIMRLIHRVLTRALSAVRGVLVEDKGLTLSVHYRCVHEDSVGEVRRIFDRVVGGAQALGKVRVTSGKKVYEVRPAAPWDKGKAIELLLKRYGGGAARGKVLPIYLGDDVTDEDGFRAIARHGSGIAVFVGTPSPTSAARYYLDSPAQVTRFLATLLEGPDTGQA